MDRARQVALALVRVAAEVDLDAAHILAVWFEVTTHGGRVGTGIDAIAAELKTKGVKFTKEPTTVRPGVRICFIRGPEGISIELLDRSVA